MTDTLRLGRLYECCQKMYDSGHENSGSTACPMPKVVRKWLEDHPVAEAVRMQRRGEKFKLILSKAYQDCISQAIEQ